MKNKNISDEEYNICINAWKDNNMKTFKDFLEWYNSLDVLAFIEAVEKMKTFYKNKKLDLFKNGVSLPGLVLKYLMVETEKDFYLFDEEDGKNHFFLETFPKACFFSKFFWKNFFSRSCFPKKSKFILEKLRVNHDLHSVVTVHVSDVFFGRNTVGVVH
jgi:hypothetical protein